jgi:hypothetical protein
MSLHAWTYRCCLCLFLASACHGAEAPSTAGGGTSPGPGGDAALSDGQPDVDAQEGPDAQAESPSDGGAATGEACNDGTGAWDCCPAGAVGGESCAGASSTCSTRCSFADDAATQGTRSYLYCSGGTWLSGHGLFPCSRR